MMYSLMLAVLAAVGPSSPTTIPVTNLHDLFAQACLDGQVRLARSEVQLIRFEDLPGALRHSLGKPSSGQVWRLNAPGRAYLYILNYEPGGGRSPKICGLASDKMPLNRAAEALERRIDGHPLRQKRRGTQWWRPQDGYIAIATTAADFNVVQLNWLSEKDRKRLLKELRREAIPIASPVQTTNGVDQE